MTDEKLHKLDSTPEDQRAREVRPYSKLDRYLIAAAVSGDEHAIAVSERYARRFDRHEPTELDDY